VFIFDTVSNFFNGDKKEIHTLKSNSFTPKFIKTVDFNNTNKLDL
jgi:hypothetical protein